MVSDSSKASIGFCRQVPMDFTLCGAKADFVLIKLDLAQLTFQHHTQNGYKRLLHSCWGGELLQGVRNFSARQECATWARPHSSANFELPGKVCVTLRDQ